MPDAPPISPLAEIFSEAGRLERYLAFEAALAEVEAELGLIPEEAAREIARVATPGTIDTEKLAADTRRTGYPIAPLARQLAAACRGDLGQFVHWGSTTQDVMDTALAMQFRDAFAHVEGDLKGLARDLAGLAARHRDTPMAARAFGGHALPFTFGAKVARWLAPVCRHVERLEELRPRVLVGQFGGAAGTLASFGGRGAEARERLLARLGLGEAVAVWHTARDTVAEAACFMGLVTATLGKIGHDVAALGASDVGEAFEPVSGGRDASSALPQKRNPVYSGRIVANARIVASHVSLVLDSARHDHERGPQGFVENMIAPEIFVLAGEALAAARHVAAGLRVDAARMRANLESSRGAVMAEAAAMALAPRLGRLRAKDLVHDACLRAEAEAADLASVLASTPDVAGLVDGDELARAMEPRNYLGAAGAEVDRTVALAREIAG